MTQRVRNKCGFTRFPRHNTVIKRKNHKMVEIERARFKQTHDLQSFERLAFECDPFA
ncbi:hypothetical protein IMSAG025_00988 [Muribaculaceae bacterium]|nr:hypothetical protein IMSAG025_00988 [Muribaculaceae bacterium]